MSGEWNVPAWALVAAGVGVVVLLLVSVFAGLGRRQARRLAADAERRAQRDRETLAAIEQRLARLERPAATGRDTEYTITSLGDQPDTDTDTDSGPDRTPAVPTVPGPLFADLVLREGVVQVVSLAAGLRRALDPATRGRIRAEMRREVKRARRQRRTEVRAARRELHARQRAEPAGAAVIEPSGGAEREEPAA